MLLLAPLALAAPPSSTLSGPNGTLSWSVVETAAEVRIAGRSPKWTVEHTAGPDLAPRRTTRTGPEGTVTVRYTAEGAEVTRAGETTRVSSPGAWDGDTIDVRLGAAVAAGRRSFTFTAIDAAGAKAYGFEASFVADERCGATACVHEKVVMTGVYRLVGPTWEYWYAPDGRLLRFVGPIGTFTAPETP